VQLGNHTLVLYGEGEEIEVSASEEGLELLLFAGRPLKEPVAWYGPIVMNTREELRTAFAELEAGSFLKPPDERVMGEPGPRARGNRAEGYPDCLRGAPATPSRARGG